MHKKKVANHSEKSEVSDLLILYFLQMNENQYLMLAS